MTDHIKFAYEDSFSAMANLDFAGGNGSLGNEIPELLKRAEQLMLDIKEYAESKGIDVDS
jgi:hypothetical protein